MFRQCAWFSIALAASCCLVPSAGALEVISTRGEIEFWRDLFWDTAIWKNGQPSPALPADLSPGSMNCPESIVIYIHGFDNTGQDAMDNFVQAEAALQAQGYMGLVVGYSWDSNPGTLGFDAARSSANRNGKVLASVLLQIKQNCPDTKINIITHSLGARVALTALKCGGCADTTQLMAPAVDNEVLESGEEFGDPMIATRGGGLKIWFNAEDDILEDTYPPEEGDTALGEKGPEHDDCLPPGITSCDAEPKLKAGSDDGASRNPQPSTTAGGDAEDDHSGYIWSDPLMMCVHERLL